MAPTASVSYDFLLASDHLSRTKLTGNFFYLKKLVSNLLMTGRNKTGMEFQHGNTPGSSGHKNCRASFFHHVLHALFWAEVKAYSPVPTCSKHKWTKIDQKMQNNPVSPLLWTCRRQLRYRNLRSQAGSLGEARLPSPSAAILPTLQA